jgi:hypothetical protein
MGLRLRALAGRTKATTAGVQRQDRLARSLSDGATAGAPRGGLKGRGQGAAVG